MSVQIDLTEKLSDEDRRYLLARGRRHHVIQNDRRFNTASSSSSAPQGTTQDGEWATEVRELTVQELKDELSNRGLATTGKQADLQARLIEAGPEDNSTA